MDTAPEAALQPFPFVGDSDTLREPITQALRTVIDPEVALSIVDIGLVYQVTVEDERVHVLMTMTSAACPVADEILDDVERALDQVVPPGWLIETELCWEPPWTPAAITPEGRRRMGW